MRLPLLALAVTLCGAASAEPQGKALFTEGAVPACSVCHTLADAGSAGDIGPNLDDLAPTADQVRAALRQGVGVMPNYADTLGEAEIDALADYVSAAAGGLLSG